MVDGGRHPEEKVAYGLLATMKPPSACWYEKRRIEKARRFATSGLRRKAWET
jgi:hypothetical protein